MGRMETSLLIALRQSVGIPNSNRPLFSILTQYSSSQRLGIPVIDSILTHNSSEVAAAAKLLGFPVALKICSEAIPHKTERGGVAMNIKDKASLGKAVREMRNKFPDVPHTLLVQKMAKPGIELILGVRRDPVFGPVVLAGIGGIFTEIFRDTGTQLRSLYRNLQPSPEQTGLCMLLRRDGPGNRPHPRRLYSARRALLPDTGTRNLRV